MLTSRKPAAATAAQEIRRMLKTGGSAEHAQTAQRFFKEEIRSYGWRTGDLRRAVVHKRREILKQFDLKFLLQVADNLFNCDINEDKNAAVFLLEDLTDKFGDPEFSLLKSWLPRISNWSDHDALVHYLIGPMIATKPARAKNVFRWAKSPDRWHRRAACVALIQGTWRKMFFPEIVTTWCKKGWAGFCARLRKQIQSEPYSICGESEGTHPDWCSGLRVRHCIHQLGARYWDAKLARCGSSICHTHLAIPANLRHNKSLSLLCRRLPEQGNNCVDDSSGAQGCAQTTALSCSRN